MTLLARLLRADRSTPARTGFRPLLMALEARDVPAVVYQSSYDLATDWPETAHLEVTASETGHGTWLWEYELTNGNIGEWMGNPEYDGIAWFEMCVPVTRAIGWQNFRSDYGWNSYGSNTWNSAMIGLGVDQYHDNQILIGESSTISFEALPLGVATLGVSGGDRTWMSSFTAQVAGPLFPTAVTAVPYASAHEAGATPADVTDGTFFFRREGYISQALTVPYTVLVGPDLTLDAEPGTDYVALSGTVTFAPNSMGASVTVTPHKDNEFEETERVRIRVDLPTTPAPVFVEGYPEAEVMLADDEPRVSAVAEWNPSTERPQIATITLTRSGGNLDEALDAWFEAQGTYSESINSLAVVTAGIATFAAGQTQLTVNLAAANLNGNAALAMLGAVPVEQTNRVVEIANLLDGSREAFAVFVDNLAKLDPPLTYQDYVALNHIIEGEHDEFFPDASYKQLAVRLASGLRTLPIDWRTVPLPGMAVGGSVVAFVKSAQGLAKIQGRIGDLVQKLSSPIFRERETASAELKSLVESHISRLHLEGVVHTINYLRTCRGSADPEARARIESVLAPAEGLAHELLLKFYRRHKGLVTPPTGPI